MTTMMIHMLGLRMATSVIASSSVGKAIITSVKRISTLSKRPPKKPATEPMTVPRATASELASTPTSKLTCAP